MVTSVSLSLSMATGFIIVSIARVRLKGGYAFRKEYLEKLSGNLFIDTISKLVTVEIAKLLNHFICQRQVCVGF